MIHLYTGNGKGKTTAAIGLCIRTAGWNMQVCFAQFMKGNDTGELYVLKSLPGVTILRSEKNFGFYSSMSESDKEIELVLTGRSAQIFLSDIADYVTEMECMRHPYEKGIGARKGIEF